MAESRHLFLRTFGLCIFYGTEIAPERKARAMLTGIAGRDGRLGRGHGCCRRSSCSSAVLGVIGESGLHGQSRHDSEDYVEFHGEECEKSVMTGKNN